MKSTRDPDNAHCVTPATRRLSVPSNGAWVWIGGPKGARPGDARIKPVRATLCPLRPATMRPGHPPGG
jgi:hypothetical protein